MSINQIQCRAEVSVGGISVETPFVQSFNVRKQRGQPGTFDASLKVLGSSVGGAAAGGDVKIYGQGKLIFTGICRQAKISPCFDDPAYVILSISGADALSLLYGKKYTRRCRSVQSTWAGITGVVREGLRSGKFMFNGQTIFTTTGGTAQSAYDLTGSSRTNPSPPVNKPPGGDSAAGATLSVTIYEDREFGSE